VKSETIKQFYGIYDEEFHRQSQRRQSLETMLRAALQEGELEVHFQPQADLHTGKIVGAESLLRWRIPETGWVPPNQIISIAEDSDSCPHSPCGFSRRVCDIAQTGEIRY